MNSTLVYIVFTFLHLSALAEDYSRHKLIELVNSGNNNNLQRLSDELNEQDGVHILNGVFSLHPKFTAMVAPDQLDFVFTKADQYKVSTNILSHNVQALIEKQKRKVFKRDANENHGFNLEEFHPLDEIYDYLKSLGKLYKDVELTSVGKSYEDEDIYLLKIGGGEKPGIFIECGIHAREWASHAVCLSIITDLLINEEHKADGGLRDKYNWYFMPVVNPDGYKYTWDTNRHWRKNRKPGKKCTGVDLNRNWDIHFGKKGASGEECAEDYHGTSAFSETESQTEANVIFKLKDHLLASWSIHSYFQMYMIPYCYTKRPAHNDKELLRVASIGREAIVDTHNTTFQVGQCSKLAYIASGSAMDWIYDVADIPYAFTIEVRDMNTGFMYLLPPEQIKPTYEETWNGIKATATALKIN